VEKAAQRSGAAFSTAAGDRSTTLRRSRRRSPAGSSSAFGFSPNSRQSRIGTSRASSHLQGRDILKGISNFIGIDVSKDSLDVASLPEGTIRTVAHTIEGRRQLIARLPQPGDCLVVIEATGGYERPLVLELTDAGHLVAVVNPRQVRDFAKGIGVLAKTDRLDAAVIAKFGEQVRPRPLAEVREKQTELDQLVTRRRQLVDLRTAEKNRGGLVASEAVRRSLQQVIDVLNDQIEQIEKQILQLVDADDQWRGTAALLKSVPGIGDVTAATLIAEFPELGNVNRHEAAALAGLAPFNDDSGTRQGKRSIRGGRRSVRTVLYMATLSAIRHNPVIRKFATRLKDQGKLPKVIITACMRKLLVILNTMIKTNSHWNPEFV
jgi:transposase